ncbi:MAG: phage holin family protein [Pyrinomonadaceae bacterium]
MAQPKPTIQKDERSLGDLFSELATDTSTLIRQEVALAQVEITQKATRVGTQIAYLVVGGAIALLAVLSLLAALIIGLGQIISNVAGVLPLTGAWISALIVGVVVGGIAAYLITSALSKLRETNLTPQKTVDSLKEDAQWLKDQVS